MGVRVVPFESCQQACRHVEELIRTGRKGFCVAVNPEKIHQAGKDPRLLAALRQADMGICDGIGVALGVRLLHGRTINRCTGCDLFLELIAVAARNGWRVFLLGASAQSNQKACEELLRRHPGLSLAGRQDGYFQDSAQVVERINASQADLLFVAMGSPRQELWIAEHRRSLNAAFCMGVGGSFDVVSGRAKRAPKIFRKTGTEFLFRLITDPRRWKRQLALPKFMFAVLERRLFEVPGRIDRPMPDPLSRGRAQGGFDEQP